MSIFSSDNVSKKPDLMSYLASYYSKSVIANKVQDAYATEIKLTREFVEDIVRQFFIDTATWGLIYWEEEYNIKTDLNKSYKERRELIKAKERGRGTSTIDLIKLVVSSFSNGRSDVHEDFINDILSIHFIGSIGQVLNINGLREAVEEIIPAHLDYEIIVESPNIINIKTKFKSFENTYLECGTTGCFIQQYNIVGDYL